MTIGTNYNTYNNYTNYNTYMPANASESGNQVTPYANEEQKLRLPGTPDSEKTKKPADSDEQKKAGRKSSPADCETCKNRKYQDGSDEANVSFKAAAHVSPQAAGAAVRSHENQHVSNAYKKAAQNNGEVLSATVSIHTAVCPECGRSYISGGTTNTMIKYTNESNPYQKALKATDAVSLRGANLDLSA